jgi:transcriptional regulator NrdR family protein
MGLFRARKDKPLKYKPCPMCGAMDWLMKGNGEFVERWGQCYIRRAHQCGSCRTRFTLVRHIKDHEWHFTHIAAALAV